MIYNKARKYMPMQCGIRKLCATNNKLYTVISNYKVASNNGYGIF
jgi:hypothetical protein